MRCLGVTKLPAILKLLAAVALLGGLTVAPAAAQAQSAPAAATVAMPADLGNLLGQIEQASQATADDLNSLRIERWKADSSVKRQSQTKVDSVQRNISSALPGLVQSVRASPGSVAAQFKLYRNMNALYDVLSGVTESAGAFGGQTEFQTLSGDLTSIDNARRALADRLATVTAQQDADIARLRSAVQTAQAAAAAAAASAPPRKIVVDDTPAASKTTHKKKPASASSEKPAPPPAQPKPQQ